MPDPTDQSADAGNGAPAATDTGHQQGIVDNLPEWKEALAVLAKSDPSKAEALSKKIEGYDKRFTERMTKLSEREREIAKMAEDLKAAATTPAKGSVASTRAEGQKVLDALLDASTDSSTREGIRQLREAIREETDIEKLKETVADLKGQIQQMVQSSQISRMSELSKEIVKLEEIYGADLVEKYKGEIESNTLKYPGHTARRWLHSLADPDELDQALRIHAKKQAERTNGKESSAERKPEPRPATSTKPSPVAEQYKGKGPSGVRSGFEKAIADSVKAGLGKLALGR